MTDRFADETFSREHRCSIGRDRQNGRPYLSIPVANRLATYEEYDWLTLDECALFPADGDAARRSAGECRERLHDDRLILQPGSDRGAPAWERPPRHGGGDRPAAPPT